MLNLILTTLSLVILVYFARKIYNHFYFWQKQNVPCLPFIALSWAWMPMQDYIMKQSRKYGSIYGIYKGSVKTLILNDAKMARELSTKEFHKFPIRNSFFKGKTNINKALFFMEANEDWKRIRSIVTPAFTTGKLKRMITPIERIAGNFIEHLRPMAASGEEFDLKKYISGFAMDVIACCENHDLIGLMIESSHEQAESSTKGILTPDEISGQGILFFIAGFDTTHATFDHVIYYLTQYPEWQEKLFQELNSVRDELDYDKIKDLPILNAIINETLRLNPPLIVFHREAKEDCELLDTGIKIPKNTIISIQPYVIHRNPEYFSEPLAFKPERFLDKSLESNFAYMPFGAGPRLCVGMRFAQNELRIGLANFVLNYRVEAKPGIKLEYFYGSVLMSPKRLMVKISER